jgi:hypothetical protein
MRQEGRHVAFCAGEAEQRLARSRRTQWLCRQALTHLWRPVGSGVMPRTEVTFVIGGLFGDADGRKVAQRIDGRVGRPPGLVGLRLVEGAIDRYAAETVAVADGCMSASFGGRATPRRPAPEVRRADAA